MFPFPLCPIFPLETKGVGVEGGQGGLHRASDAAARGLRGLVPRTVHARPGHDRRRHGSVRPAAREGKKDAAKLVFGRVEARMPKKKQETKKGTTLVKKS